MKKLLRLSAICLAAVIGAGLAGKPAAAAPLYTLTKTVLLGSGTHFDYLHYDAATDRVYAILGDRVGILDANSGDLVGVVHGLKHGHGITVLPKLNLGYADDDGNNDVIVFDLTTLEVVKTIGVVKGADGLIYDAPSKRLYMASGDAGGVQPINPATNTAGKLIDLGGAPEYLVSDGAGSLYVALNDKNKIARVNTKTNTMTASWDVPGCKGPTGMSINEKSRRLFVSCDNSTLAVVNADTGAVVATLPIGLGSDADEYDAKRNLVFSTNRDGTLSIIKVNGPDSYTALDPVKTLPNARTIALDPSTGRLFMITAEVDSVKPPKKAGELPVYKYKPDSLEALEYDPAQ